MRESSVIMAVKKDKKGKITHFMMSNGQVYDFSTALRMAETGQLENVYVSEQDGEKFITSMNGQKKTALEELPLFE